MRAPVAEIRRVNSPDVLPGVVLRRIYLCRRSQRGGRLRLGAAA
ncbi:hypothetical protein TUZN_0851 [Thermoproteus uzoniensis 768-20]|uniref:Uncharacterized protein n=1 Tax=Thermoproteus uzoniensis (strain 768-20) TaxID=999630 RepID=F2L5G6_THEU7|nr:hypothetical protein TUZN_0851 [Thermoproteus uzoniensis 768-20]